MRKFVLGLGLALGGLLTGSLAQAYNLEACAKEPLNQKPEVINLLEPIDQKMIDCIPKLDEMADKWKSYANKIQSALSQISIGNDGNTRIDKLQYNTLSNTIQLVASIQAKHTWIVTIPEVKEKVPVDKWKWKEIPYPDVRWVNKCGGPRWARVCTKVPEYFTNYRKEKVPYVVLEMKVISPARSVKESASATCSYDYTFNLNTLERKPIFSCGGSSLGTYKLDASAITNILNGEIPSLGSLISTVSLTPPGFIDKNENQYAKVRDEIIAANQGSFVYFSSESFVNWASAENHSANVILAAITGGSYSAELVRQIEEKLVTELQFITSAFATHGVSFGKAEIIDMLVNGKKLDLNGFNVSVKAVNTPYVIKKCIADRDECTPGIPLPRLGFAIVVSPH